MRTRLFHAVVICGAALSASTLGCCSKQPYGQTGSIATVQGGQGGHDPDPDPQDRCKLPNGECNEHCPPVGVDQCLDPCFVHTTTCNPVCVQPDGSCGWPPTK